MLTKRDSCGGIAVTERLILEGPDGAATFEGDLSQLDGNLTGKAWVCLADECHGPVVVSVSTVAGVPGTSPLSRAESDYVERVQKARLNALDGRRASGRFCDLAQARQDVVDATAEATGSGYVQALGGWPTVTPHRPGAQRVSDINTAISLDILRRVGTSCYAEYARAAFERFKTKEWSELSLSSLPSTYSTEAIAWVMSGLAGLDDFIASRQYEAAGDKLKRNSVDGGWGSSWPTEYNEPNRTHTSLVVTALSQYDDPMLRELAADGVDWLKRCAREGIWESSDPLLKVAWSSLAITALSAAGSSVDASSIGPLICLFRDKSTTDPLTWPQRISYNSETRSETRLFTHFIGASRATALLDLGVSPLDADVLESIRRILGERYRDGVWRMDGYPSPFYARGAVLLLVQWMDCLASRLGQAGIGTVKLRLGDSVREAGDIDGRMTWPLDGRLAPSPGPDALAAALLRDGDPPRGLTDLLARSQKLPQTWSAQRARYRHYSGCASSVAFFADWLLGVRTRQGPTYLEHMVSLGNPGLDDTDSVLAAVATTSYLYAYGSYVLAACDAIAVVGSARRLQLDETLGFPEVGVSDLLSAATARWSDAQLSSQAKVLAVRDWVMAGIDAAAKICVLDDSLRACVSRDHLAPGTVSAADLALNLQGVDVRTLARLGPVLKTLLLIDSPEYTVDFDDDPLTAVFGLSLALTGPAARSATDIEGGPLRPYFELVVSPDRSEPAAPTMLKRDLAIEFRRAENAPGTWGFNEDAFKTRVEQELRRFRGGPFIGTPCVKIEGVREPEILWYRRGAEILAERANEEVFRFPLAPGCPVKEEFAFHLLAGLVQTECFCKAGEEPCPVLPVEDVRTMIGFPITSQTQQGGFTALEKRVSISPLARLVSVKRRKVTPGAGTTQAYWLELREGVTSRYRQA
jgi:hypothetical protein